ncbi:hypothetical protein PM082_016273 [Marasmius tenuissimus]|nr:hypothetical protein PM082_016273 [Marasmius tenuissimus]
MAWETQRLSSIEDLAMRVLGVNFVAVHTTSAAITTSLHRLAANPHVADSLREEINHGVLGEEGGWSKTAVVKMYYLLDSFLKESTRMDMIGPFGVSRVALKDFKFSDGTAIPAGTKVAMAAHNIHHTNVGNVFVSIWALIVSELNLVTSGSLPVTGLLPSISDKGDTLKNHMATPTWGWLRFGAGKHACSGRFFAVNELKILLSHIVLNYDVKFPDDNIAFPDPIVVGTAFMPNNRSKVLFRERQV